MDEQISEEKFYLRMGRKPEMDDLSRCNCPVTGEIGHFQCGWNKELDLPVFLVGHIKEMIVYFKDNLLEQHEEDLLALIDLKTAEKIAKNMP